MPKRVSNEISTSNSCEINNEIIASTSSNVSEPKKSRMEYNFWGNNEEEQKSSNEEMKIVKINEFALGKV